MIQDTFELTNYDFYSKRHEMELITSIVESLKQIVEEDKKEKQPLFIKINDGFIMSLARKVVHEKHGKDTISRATDEIVYLSADDERKHYVTHTEVLSDGDKILGEIVAARYKGEFIETERTNVEYVDIAPRQVVGAAASLIPFVSHDEANRALMGTHMQCQAVPLVNPESPIVGTGMEAIISGGMKRVIRARHAGVVEFIDGEKVVVKLDKKAGESGESAEDFELIDDGKKEVYFLSKFKRTAHSTCYNQVARAVPGQKVEAGDLLVDGPASQLGELGLGRNMIVAYANYGGYGFEDAILISDRLVKEDLLTSIHIEEYEAEVVDTKLGPEEITNDIPNVSAEMTKNLDENGLIRIGAEVREGDILIGKITPKGESDPSPEEKLLRAIFGDKAGDVKDASLKATPSLYGTVIDKKLFTRSIKDKKSKVAEKPMLLKYEKDFEKGVAELKEELVKKLFEVTNGKSSQGVKDYYGNIIIAKGSKFIQKHLNEIDNYRDINPTKWLTDKDKSEIVCKILTNYTYKYKELEGELKRKVFALTVGDELPSGILQLAKVFVAQKRKLKVGDKMAGRHGNKGIVSRIVRDEDMPFLEDGTPVDIVLNPLGVPSRMNLGQIYETVLGWAGRELGEKFATPIFDGATLDEINEYSKKAGIPLYGKTYLYDGGTGEKFDQTATVGIIYMLKLGHLVDDKMHARSIGPYSLITQQPLGGKAQFGGQRFGEMEVWAIEAFGASNILQEILTIKSDDVIGRARAYESIVKGEPMPKPNLPESFNVLLHELSGLGLKIEFE